MNARFFLFNALVINLLGILYILIFGFQNNVENFLYSLFYRPEDLDTENILIIDIDDETIGRINRWPIPREYFAKVLRKVSSSRVIVFDIIFSENTATDTLLLKHLKEMNDRIVMPVVIKEGEVLWPNRSIRRAIRYIGTPSVIVENNGFVFRIPAMEKGGEGYYYSISLLAAYLFAGIEPYQIIKNYGEEIYFSIPRKKPQRISLYDFLKDSSSIDLSNTIVFIGSSATGVGDFFTLPTGEMVPGVEIHSYATASIIEGKVKRLVEPLYMFPIYFFVSLMLLVIFSEMPFVVWFVIGFLYTVSILVSMYIEIQKGLLLPGFFMLIPLLYIMPTYIMNFHVQILLKILENFKKIARKIALEREVPEKFPRPSDIYSMKYEDLSKNLDFISDYIDREIQLIMQLANTLNIGIMVENERGEVLFMNKQFSNIAPSKEDLAGNILEKDGRIYRIDVLESGHFRIYTLSDITHEERQARDYQLLFRMLNHEIRTPLNVVMGYWDLYKFRGMLEEEKKEKIEKALHTITNILDGFALIAKSRAGLVSKFDKVVQVHQLATEILENLKLEYFREGLHIETKCRETNVRTDPMLLRVILKNLIENALKYAKSKIEIECDGKRLSIINDTDMDPKEVDRIFEPFYRGRGTGKAKGLGLGMTIVKELCESLGIRIEAHYEKEIGGIRITLTFPEGEGGSG